MLRQELCLREERYTAEIKAARKDIAELATLIQSLQDQLTATTANTISPPYPANEDEVGEADQGPADSPQIPTPPPAPTSPVRFDNLVLGSVTTEDLISAINFEREGQREIACYGTDYQYGGKVHTAIPFPTEGPLRAVIDELGRAYGSLEGFSCLATLYRNGNSTIPWHQDDENQITQGSDIICVSIGASRSLHIRSLSGEKRYLTFPLVHGSWYVLTEEGRVNWEHCIPKEPNVREARVSLTFRRLEPIASTPKPKVTVPEIKNPATPHFPTKRVLILGDSMYPGLKREFPNRSGLQVIQRNLYRLDALEEHSHLFDGTDLVFISAGINDLTRYGHRSWSLLQKLRPMMQRLCRDHPNTVFVLNSILLTSLNWVNWHIEDTNFGLFEMALSIPNLHFLDSHEWANWLWWCGGCHVIDPRGNGVHLSTIAKHRMSRFITVHLVDWIYGGAGKLCVWKNWPIREDFVCVQGFGEGYVGI